MRAALSQITGKLAFSTFVTVLGNSFLYGYNIAVINTPAMLIERFYNKTYYERSGSDFQLVVMWEENRQMLWQKGNLTPAENDNMDPAAFKMDLDLLLAEWQLELLWSFTVAIFVFSGMIGALASASISDNYGRKKGMILISGIMFLAGLFGGLTILMESPELLMLSRILVGLHSGMNISLCPIYLAEITPKGIRGAIGACHQLAITVGILTSQILGLPELMGTPALWPLLFAFNAVPAFISLILMPFCPASPRFLLIKLGQEEDARKALVALRGTSNVEEEMEVMRVERSKQMGIKEYSLAHLLSNPYLRIPTLVACMLQATQQWSGINAVMSYSTLIFAQAGVSLQDMPYVVVATGSINVLSTIVMVPLMEMLGRRTLLLWPMVTMVISFILLTVFLYLLGQDSEHSSQYAYMCIFVAHTYIIGFAVGLGPIPHLYVGEIFPQEPRAVAMGLSISCNWICNFILMIAFPAMKDSMMEYTYIVFIVILVPSIVFMYFFVLETKNRTFEEIGRAFSLMRGDKEGKRYYAFSKELPAPADPQPLELERRDSVLDPKAGGSDTTLADSAVDTELETSSTAHETATSTHDTE